MENCAVKDLQGIIERINVHKEYLQKRFKIKEIGVFCSFVRGEQKKREVMWIFLLSLKKRIFPASLSL